MNQGRVARFQLVSGSREYPLLPGEWIIGRSPRAGVSVDDGLVSREHALLRVRKDSVEVEDLKSSNGTFVNARRLEAPSPLCPGDLLRVGDTLFSLERVQAAGAAEDEASDPSLPPLALGRRAEETDIGEGTYVSGDVRPPRTPPVRPLGPRPGTPAEPCTALLVLGDPEWAELIRRAAAIHPNLTILLADPGRAGALAAGVKRGVLVLDLDAAGAAVGSILAAWSAPTSRGPVLISAARPEHEGVILAREMKVDGYVRRGKPSILAVAQLRYHLQRTAVSAGAGDETGER